jgi:hypothetical protein
MFIKNTLRPALPAKVYGVLDNGRFHRFPKLTEKLR